MTLLEIRKKLVEITGRYDLVVNPDEEDWRDAGADFFIRAGQSYLDRRVRFSKELGDMVADLPIGETVIPMDGFRAVTGVGVMLNNGIYWLQYVPATSIHNDYRGALYDTSTLQSLPLQYTTVSTRGGLPDSLPESAIGVHVWPAPNQPCKVALQGLQFSSPLVEEDSSSYWSLVEPFLLVQAAAMKMEEMYRNSSGVRDYRDALELVLTDIDKDEVEADVARPLQMRNSW